MEKLTKNEKIRRIAESAIMIALATVLCEVLKFDWPYGGSITIFGQVPLIIISYRYGVKWGTFSGLVMGIIQMLFGLSNFSWVKGIVAYLILAFADYIIAFGALGLGGMFRNKIKNQVISISLGAFVVSFIRFLCHFISGVTIWGDYANGAPAVWIYSLTYNGGYMLPEAIITVAGCAVIAGLFNLTSKEIKVKNKIIQDK